jgi:putative colanic acid biosynthesis UDP-glucose lipid carrier transferase
MTRHLLRLADGVFAVMGLVLLLPVMSIIALAICCRSPGPAWVRTRRRLGDGATHLVDPFRTTHVNSSQLTAVGRFLQRHSLDRLPALITILRGDMSLNDLMTGHLRR